MHPNMGLCQDGHSREQLYRKVYTWVGKRIWIAAGFAQAFAGKDGANFIYNDEQPKPSDSPDAYLTHRKAVEDELNHRFACITNDSEAVREHLENEGKSLLKG